MNTSIDYTTMNTPVLDRSDLRVMLWAGDCVHNGIPDVQRLPGYDVYVCNGFKDLSVNLAVLPRGAHICVIDIYNQEQFMRFVNDFTGKCLEINSDYHGSTPSLSIDTYSILLGRKGIAYNINGIKSGFNPADRFRRFLELFAPILPASLKARRFWTERILKLAEWNCISPEFVYTDHELKHGSYRHIWDDQNAFRAEHVKINPQFAEASKYTDETLEEYWGLLSTSILTNPIHELYFTFMDPAEKALIESYYPRFQKFLWLRSITPALDGTGKVNLNDLNEYVYEDLEVKTQIRALQTVLGHLDTAETCSASNMTPSIAYYIDTRRNYPERVFGLSIQNF